MSSPFKIVDGTATVPSLSFNSESSTGIYRPSAGQLAFTTLGVNAASLGVSGVSALAFIPTGSAVPTNGLYLPAANTLSIATNSTQRLTINSTGHVSINAPSSGSALTITGIGSSNSQALVAQATVGTAPANMDIGEIMNITNLSTTGDQRLISFGQVGPDAFIRPIQEGASTAAGLLIATQSGGTRFAPSGGVTILAPSSAVALTVNGTGGANLAMNISSGAANNVLQMDSTNANGPYAFFSRSNTVFGYIGNGAVLGSTLDHLALRGESGIDFITNGGTHIAGTITAAGNITINPPSSGVALSVNSNASGSVTLNIADNFSGAGSSTQLQVSAPNNSNGVNILLGGNGSTTPNKWLRVLNGHFGIVNSAFTAEILSLTDTGVLIAGSFSGSGSGLTGTAASLSIGGNAATLTNTTSSANTNFVLPMMNGNSMLTGSATYNPATNTLSAGSFSGAGTGLTGSAAGLNVGGSAASCPANAVTGSTLAAGVTASSLTSVGTLGNLTVSGATTTNGINLSGNIFGTSSGFAFTISPDPLATFTSAGYIQLFGSTAGAHVNIGAAGVNTLVITGTSAAVTGTMSVSSTVTATGFTVSSDRNKKENIRVIVDAQEVVQSLNGVRYDWKADGTPSAGVIAQDVEVMMPELVITADDGSKGVNYNGLIGVLIEEVKALRKEVEILKAR
jgi:hypothetical protein